MLCPIISKFARSSLLWLLAAAAAAHAQTVTISNVLIRVAAANLTSGNNQRYETPGIRILKGLKPDIVCIQEFNYSSSNGNGANTAAAFREMVDNTFGTNFNYYREPGAYNIPNGIISHWPIASSGSWASDVGDRGYAWAQIRLPGTNDLYAVSVHLKASSGSASQRAAEATVLKSNILANFPANAWLIIAGDMNLYSDSETAIATLTTIAADQPVPADQSGDVDTNAGRSERYDRVLVSPTLTNHQVPVVIGANRFTNGLVFDSRVYSPLGDVAPIQSTDSGASNMQHMAVVKDFQTSYLITNTTVITSPLLGMEEIGILHWNGTPGTSYRVQGKTNVTSAPWILLGSASSSTTNFSFTNNSQPSMLFRLVYP